jgi:hypothetical protein
MSPNILPSSAISASAGGSMTKRALPIAAIVCLVIWAAIWVFFLSMRFSTFDVRRLPGAGMLMLGSLIIALLAPFVAAALSGAALIRAPRAPLTFLVFGCALAVLFGQAAVFLASRWM